MSAPEAGAAPEKSRKPWIWISGVLAVVAVGLLVWGLNTRSDLDAAKTDLDTTRGQLANANKELDATQKKLDTAMQDLKELEAEQAKETRRRAVVTAATLATVKRLYGEMSDELGATQQDLAAAQQAIEDANEKTAEAEDDAAAAKKEAEEADNKTDKAEAEADQARAEAEASLSRSQVVTECAKAYISAFGTLFEGDDVSSQVPAVQKDISAITAACKSASSGG